MYKSTVTTNTRLQPFFFFIFLLVESGTQWLCTCEMKDAWSWSMDKPLQTRWKLSWTAPYFSRIKDRCRLKTGFNMVRFAANARVVQDTETVEEIANFFCNTYCYFGGIHRYNVFAFVQSERTLRNDSSVTISEHSDLASKLTQRKSNVWQILRYNDSRCCTSSLHQQEESIPVECVPPAFPSREGRGGFCPPAYRERSAPGEGDPDRQTPVKILPCPKLRLWAVTRKRLLGHSDCIFKLNCRKSNVWRLFDGFDVDLT